VKVLVACEYSGVVRDAFIARGHDAMSCDLLPTERLGPHYKGNVFDILYDGWDMMIAHPPCTYLCRGGLTWIYRDPGRLEKQHEAIEFVRRLLEAPIEKIALENPIGKISTIIRKPDQITYPFEFGHIYKKDICLWLKNLPPLSPTYIVPGPHKTFDFASSNRYTKNGASKKSKTFKGVARAMAEQWG
jgi:hypothetical protein